MTTRKTSKPAPVTKSTPAESAPQAVALSSTASPAVSPPVATSSPHATALAGTELPPLQQSVVSECVSLINQIGTLLGSVEELSPLDIRHALKMRKGGPQLVPQLADLCNHNGITSVGNMTVQGMTDMLARVNSLNTIGVALGALQKKLDDASFMAESNVWQSATTFYTLLQRMTSRSPTLARALQPVQAFFQTRKTKGNRQAANAATKVKVAAQAVAKHPEAAAAAHAPSAGATTPGSTATGSSSAGGDGAAPVASPPPVVVGSGIAAGTSPVAGNGVAAPVAAATNGAAHP